MKRVVRIHAAFFAGLLFAITGSQLALYAQNDVDAKSPPAPPGTQGLLVLHDGGVLVGQITRNGDRYLLTRSGNEMQIPAASVMLVSTSLEEAYKERRGRLTGPTADAHLALAEWCLRYNLLEQAAREMADARELESHHPRLVLLERRLAIAREHPKERSAAPPSKSRPTVANQTEPLQSSIGVLPEAAIERFTRKVQPVLVNNCTTSGCHERGGTQRFQLDRAILYGMANRRSTMHNLAATLELVDRVQPKLSPLLTVLREPHGGKGESIFGPRQDQAFAHLVDWVGLVTNAGTGEQVESPATTDADSVDTEGSSTSRLTSPVLRVPRPNGESSTAGDTAVGAIDQADPPSNSEAAGGAVPASFNEPVTPSEARRMQYGAQLKRWRPRDPFDPEIFNRQRRATEQTANAPAADGPNESR